MGQFVVGVALVGFGWFTVTTVVMVTMNVTEITDTVQTEGQLKYSQCQVPICVNVCQFIDFNSKLKRVQLALHFK